ncbi:hypothetical protein Tco_1370739 [Tanacetum coccineum]
MYSPIFTQDMIDFQECINEIEMEDINSSGLHFTWIKSLLNPSSSILKKIDRKIKSLKPYLNKLNWKNGNLFERVVVLKAKLYDVQRKIYMNPTDKALRIEGVELLKDYKEAVLDEEKLLRQKIKITWLKEGDKNSAYFYKVLKGRINRNRIMSICAKNGRRFENLCSWQNNLLSQFKGFLRFKALLLLDNEDDNICLVSKISEEEAKNMIREINDEEIKKSLFDIDDDKALGPDGFTSKFFKKAWAVIKESFVLLLKSFSGLMLNLLVKYEISKEKAFKNHFGCKKLRITHLCYDDDLIMLCNGDTVSVKTLKQALDKFSAILGLYPNLRKCTMFYGRIDDETKENISNIFPFTKVKLPVRYLGVPLVNKKIGLLICTGPKDQGGLGFKSFKLWNKTLLVKHLWIVASRKESLWVKWINVVKLKKRSFGDINIDPKDSWGWKCLLNLRTWVGDHMRYRIGDGKSINVWHDKWNNEVSLSSVISKKEIFYAGFDYLDKISDVRCEDLMIDELKAKMVYIAVKNSNNVLLAESTWNVNLPEDID